MELSSGLFSVDYANLDEADLLCKQLEQVIGLWNLSLDQMDSTADRSPERFKLVKCFNLQLKISLVESDPPDRSNYKQLLDSVLNSAKEADYCHPPRTEHVRRIHGLANYLLIQTENKLDIIESERLIRLINGAISCAITNTKCIYPVFVQIKDRLLDLSTGCYANFGIRIQYDSALFDLDQFGPSTPLDFLKLFEGKLRRNLQLDDNVRCFLANRRRLAAYQVQCGSLSSLRFEIEQTEVLPKIQGTQWTFNAEQSVLKEFQRLENGSLAVQIRHLDRSSIFQSIVYAQELARSRENAAHHRRKEIDQERLAYFLLKSEQTEHFIDNRFAQFKGTPFDSIVFRFACFVFDLRLDDEQSDAQQTILDYWSAVVDQLRRYWELVEQIPSVEDRVPDLNTCLLQQKIQMLNCCIKEKQRREQPTLNTTRDEDGEEDEFFDCQTDPTADDRAEGRLERLEELTLLNHRNRPIYKPITQELTPYTEDNQDEYLAAYSGLSIVDSDQFLAGKNILLVSDMEAFKAANPDCCFEDFIRWYSPKDFIEAEYDEQSGQLVAGESLSERFQPSDCLWKRIWQSAKPVPVSRQQRLFNYSMEAERALEYLSTIKFEDLMRHLFSSLVQIACWRYEQIIAGCPVKSDELTANFERLVKQIAEKAKVSKQEPTVRLLGDLDERVFGHLGLVRLIQQLPGLNAEQLNTIVRELIENGLYRIQKQEQTGRLVFDALADLFDGSGGSAKSTEKEFTFVTDCRRPAECSRKLPQKLNFTVCSNEESRKCRLQVNGQFSEDIVYF